MTIKGNQLEEKAYRAIPLNSSSSLKEYSIDRKKYHKRYVLREQVEDKDNQSITMGKLVETLLYEAELFDDKFYMSACANVPTGLMLAFVEALYTATINSLDDDGNFTESFEQRSRVAYEESGFKLKYEAILKKFIGSDAEIYYEEILTVRRNNLIVVNAQDVSNTERIVEELQTNSITANIVNLEDNAERQVIAQLQVQDFEIDNLPLKGMLDELEINHNEKFIQIYDLKCVWAVEKFYEEYYLYRRAYIQAYVYFKAIEALVANDPELKDYEVRYPKFIVCDSINYYSPLIYTLDESDIENAYLGFEHKGRKYPGVKSIINDLQWSSSNDVWNISRENYTNNGIINIKS